MPFLLLDDQSLGRRLGQLLRCFRRSTYPRSHVRYFVLVAKTKDRANPEAYPERLGYGVTVFLAINQLSCVDRLRENAVAAHRLTAFLLGLFGFLALLLGAGGIAAVTALSDRPRRRPRRLSPGAPHRLHRSPHRPARCVKLIS